MYSYNGFTFSKYLTAFGVPQDSVLCTLFFVLFINDITDVIDILLYADDIKICSATNSTMNCIRFQNNFDIGSVKLIDCFGTLCNIPFFT